MKKIILVLLLSMPLMSLAQATREEVKAILFASPDIERYRKEHPNACHLYLSSEDYYKNNPVPSMDWMPWKYSMVLGKEKVEVVKSGVTEKVAIPTLSQYWLSDDEGFLMRFYDKHFFTLVVNGPVCYYVQYKFGEVSHRGEEYLFSPSMESDKFFAFHSEGLNGELVKWSDKWFDKLLTEHNLKDAYDAEKIKREMKDSVWGLETKRINKQLKYLKMINEILAKK